MTDTTEIYLARSWSYLHLQRALSRALSNICTATGMSWKPHLVVGRQLINVHFFSAVFSLIKCSAVAKVKQISATSMKLTLTTTLNRLPLPTSISALEFCLFRRKFFSLYSRLSNLCSDSLHFVNQGVASAYIYVIFPKRPFCFK